VIKLCRLVTMVWLLGCLQAHPAFACRYNVREIGFVDFGTEPYYLYGYVSQDTPADTITSFAQISQAALTDSNIRFEIINIGQQKKHPAIKYLNVWQIKSFPAAVLVSPDGQSLLVPVTKPDQPFEQVLWSVLDNVISSPKREEIIQQVSKTYGVLLLIEGADAQENKRAKEAASDAVEKISMQMKMMPKPIAHPPVLVAIDSESLSREKILLWSLGLDLEKVTKPHAAVLYGRARWIGPLFEGEQITETNLTSVLFIIGQDCECGLDYRWLQGTMLPARWDEKTQARVAESLGFDHENPMVKTEMSRIIRRGSSSYPGVPFGYQELVVESGSAIDEQQNPTVQVPDTTSPILTGAKQVSENFPPADSYLSIQNVIFILIGLFTLVLISGIVILLRSKRR